MVHLSYRTYNSYNWSSISLSQHNHTEQRKIHNAISEVSKGDCSIMGDFNHGNIKWDSQQSTGVEDQRFLCLALCCNLVTGHTTVTIGVVYRWPNITIQNNEKYIML